MQGNTTIALSFSSVRHQQDKAELIPNDLSFTVE